MTLTLPPRSGFRWRGRVPGDKSLSHRAALFAAWAEGTSRIRGFLPAADPLSTLSCLEALGVSLRREGEYLEVQGRPGGFREPTGVLDAGNSGTTLRLLSGMLAASRLFAVLTGDDSLRRRPMGRIVVPLQALGARIHGREGDRKAPLVLLPAAMRAGSTRLEVASAQVKSALLLAGLRLEGTTVVEEPQVSRDHTERMLSAMGASLERQVLPDGSHRITLAGGARLSPLEMEVPGDISSAAYFWTAAALVPGGEAVVEGVGLNPSRTGFLDVLSRMGAEVEVLSLRESGGEPVGDVRVRGRGLTATEVSGAEIPRLIDELPLVALLGTRAEGRTVVRDAAELRVKETDRIATVGGELRKLGARCEDRPDGFAVEGPTPLQGAGVESHGDHRLAMMLAVAAGIARGGLRLADWEAAAVSYPDFFDQLARAEG